MIVASNSGYELTFTENTVTKSCAGERDRARRLEEQALLQARAWDRTQRLPMVSYRVPKVLSTSRGQDSFSFTMERVNLASTIFELDPVERVLALNRVLVFVLENLRHSTDHFVEGPLLVNKVKSVLSAIGARGFAVPQTEVCLAMGDRLISEFRDGVMLPVGPMHGDLTLCNVLCQGEDVWLIDWMDGFVSSPVLDVAKLRQDTRAGWVRAFFDVDPNVLEDLDDNVVKRFWSLPVVVRWADTFTRLALLRAVPYARDPRVLDWLINRVSSWL